MYHSSLIKEDQVQRYGNIYIILYMCEKQNTCFLKRLKNNERNHQSSRMCLKYCLQAQFISPQKAHSLLTRYPIIAPAGKGILHTKTLFKLHALQ